jgi:hypothetical protein
MYGNFSGGTKRCRCHPVSHLNASSTDSFPTSADFFHIFPIGRQQSQAACFATGPGSVRVLWWIAWLGWLVGRLTSR